MKWSTFEARQEAACGDMFHKEHLNTATPSRKTAKFDNTTIKLRLLTVSDRKVRFVDGYRDCQIGSPATQKKQYTDISYSLHVGLRPRFLFADLRSMWRTCR